MGQAGQDFSRISRVYTGNRDGRPMKPVENNVTGIQQTQRAGAPTPNCLSLQLGGVGAKITHIPDAVLLRTIPNTGMNLHCPTLPSEFTGSVLLTVWKPLVSFAQH